MNNKKDFLFEALSGILSTSSYSIKPLKVVFSLYLQNKIRAIYLKYMKKNLTSFLLQIFIITLNS